MKIVKWLICILSLSTLLYANQQDLKQTPDKKLAYIVSDIRIPFWQIMSRGIKSSATQLGYSVEVFSAHNIAKRELEHTVYAIKEKFDGIIVSPTNSSACVTILRLAKQANIPVVISDIGTDAGEYVSYISSNNYDGAYGIGKILANKMQELGWQNGRVGIVAIPQKRINGQQRTAGFMKALRESNIKGADIKQLRDWTFEENYRFTTDMIEQYPDLRAIWLQSSNTYKGIVQAIKDAGKEKEILFVSFDAEPEFLDMIPQGKIVAAAMQQPYLMGKESVIAMNNYLTHQKVEKNVQLPILAISSKNIEKELPIIKLNVLGIEE